MSEERLGRFGHHPDPAIDFELEVGEIDAHACNLHLGLSHAMRLSEIERRIGRALDFRVGGDPSCVAAKRRLRAILAGLPTDAGEG